MEKLKAVIKETNELWDVYSGDDPALYDYLEIGSKGIVSVASHIVGDAIKLLIEAYKKEDKEKAKELQLFVKQVSNQLFPPFSPNPVPVKLALQQIGLGNASVRLPLVELIGNEKSMIVLELKKLYVI
jgi:4-hydroxy-tetrahydrodipicolinate synthase